MSAPRLNEISSSLAGRFGQMNSTLFGERKPDALWEQSVEVSVLISSIKLFESWTDLKVVRYSAMR